MNNNDMVCCSAAAVSPEARTLSEMQGDAKRMGEQALELAESISNHLFGNPEEKGLTKTDQTCYREVLERHCCTLDELLTTLHGIAVHLGSIKG